MLHPVHHAQATPDRVAYVMAGTGERVTYGELDARANQGARLLRSMGLGRGDGVALMLDNSPRYLEIIWAAERCGLYCTCIAAKAGAEEAGYIVRDGDCRVLVVGAHVGPIAADLVAGAPGVRRLIVDGAMPGYESYEDARDAMDAGALEAPEPGAIMLYSSGTTGRPKGVRHPLPDTAFGAEPSALVTLGRALYDFTPDMVYLSPAPLYHAAPLRWSMAVQQLGGTVVVMERFDAAAVLEAIARYRVTHAQFVPTHFIRLLRLPPEIRAAADLSSLRAVWHAAAPCPVPIKQAMIDWLGPIVHEYYAGTEGNAFCAISATEWLARKGSVGRNLTSVTKIVGPSGETLPARTEGDVFFAGGPSFSYHNDPDKTAAATSAEGWTTLGDVGWLDEDGYLYLTDRRSFTIISGGVNIYPAEIENLLVTHPAVADAAVIGVPDDEMGEAVVAVVRPADPAADRIALAAALAAFARSRLSHVKVPRRFDFRDELPRSETGKLHKRVLQNEYRGRAAGADTAPATGAA